MAAIGISEFTFGYAFLYEQTHAKWKNLKAAPILPSLQKEKDEGWDAHLPVRGTDFYYQFKLSDHLSNWNARFIANKIYSGAYYQMALHRRDKNRQHRRLRAHAAANPNTFYVAPEFNTIEDFNSAFLARQITNRSRIIPVEKCKDIYDGKQHYITFQAANTRWRQHSEPTESEESFRGEDLERLYEGTRREWRPLDRTFSIDLFERTAAAIEGALFEHRRRESREAIPLLDFNPRTASRNDVLLRTSQILSVVLGATLVLVGAPD